MKPTTDGWHKPLAQILFALSFLVFQQIAPVQPGNTLNYLFFIRNDAVAGTGRCDEGVTAPHSAVSSGNRIVPAYAFHKPAIGTA